MDEHPQIGSARIVYASGGMSMAYGPWHNTLYIAQRHNEEQDHGARRLRRKNKALFIVRLKAYKSSPNKERNDDRR